MKVSLCLMCSFAVVYIATTRADDIPSFDQRCDSALEKALYGSAEVSSEGAVELEALATAGHARSQFWLAQCLAAGTAMEQNDASANRWMERAAENGFIEAQARWGLVLIRGERGGPVDYDAAMKWLTLAAEQEDPNALAGLGYLYLNGLGVERDAAKARECYERSAALGCDEAVEMLRRMRAIRWRLREIWRSYWIIILVLGAVFLFLAPQQSGYMRYDNWVAAGSPSGEGRLDGTSLGGCLFYLILALGAAYWFFGR